jgi:hypothetical protein
MNYKTKLCLKFNKVEREQKGKKNMARQGFESTIFQSRITEFAIGTQSSSLSQKQVHIWE